MRKLTLGAIVAVACASGAGTAIAAPTITVTTYLADNKFGSPNYAAQINNQFNALYTGQTSAGTANTPSYYQAQSTITRQDLLVTNFASWKGSATPAATYGSAYANELGTRAAFGLLINGNGTKFSISQLSFSASDDLGDLDFANAAGVYNYGDGYIGIQFGADGIFGTSDDIFVSTGSNTQQVDALIGRGSGNAFAVTCGNDPVYDYGPCIDAATNQTYLDEAITDPFPTTFTGKYSLASATGAPAATGSGTFRILATGVVPEPASWALMVVGFGAIGATMRRRRRVVARAG